MDLGRAPVPSPEDAYAQAQAALESLSLPLALDNGATVTECVPCVARHMRFQQGHGHTSACCQSSSCKWATWKDCSYRWGHIDRREGFHTAVQLWPCGYEATWPESQLEGALYISRIQPDEDAEGPSFSVTLRTADGQEQVRLPLDLL